MKLIQSKNANVNYLAKIVKINNFHKHSDPEVTKLKCCCIDGFNIITGIDSEPGLYVYFPTACCINPKFLSYANLYRHGELNVDQTKTGMFDDNGRVKAIRLRGELSEGFIIPIVVLENWVMSTVNVELKVEEGTEFDSIEHDGKTFWVNKKYIPKNTRTSGAPGSGNSGKGKQPKGLDKIIENQFRFHYDTVLIKKCPHVLHPNDLISITSKVHGTSGISAYVLCKQELNWKQKIARWLTGEEFDKYDYLYSSRSVIKNQYYNKSVQGGFYGVDVWKYADDIVRPCLSKGMTAYYEIIGFLPNGGYIQKNYDYGCLPPVGDEAYTYGKHFKVQIYRVTITDVSGKVHEFSAREVQLWAQMVGLVPVEQYYYGYAKDLYPDLDPSEHWNENFLSKLANDKNFYMECNSPTCDNKVPHEGIVIKIENMKSEAFKLKCFKFLDGEGKALDKGEVDIESES
jgi:hypothetical protein